MIAVLFEAPGGVFSTAEIETDGFLGDAELLTYQNQSPLRNFTAFGEAVEEGLVYVNLVTR
jgi:hypothetical protein